MNFPFLRRIFFIPFFLLFGFVIYFLNAPILPNHQDVTYILKPGTSIQSLSADLNLKYPLSFKILAHLRGHSRYLQTGEYFFNSTITPLQLLNKVIKGRVVYHHFTIVPGWTTRRILAALNEEKHLKPIVLKDMVKNRLEGSFFPDTYSYVLNSTHGALLARAHHQMETKIEQAWARRDPYLPYKTSYEALIAASLIEKETHLDHERPLVASVLVNRLERHMRLQFDPAVIYGLGSVFKDRLHKQDLSKKTPYNVYLYAGLPPTPIASPSMPSIEAALHPAKTTYLYFVATSDGKHIFSEQLKQHNAAVNIYQKGHKK